VNPTIPQQATNQEADVELDLDDVEPDAAAMAQGSTRRDNGTGTDAEGVLS
jgi:hypothetical protein